MLETIETAKKLKELEIEQQKLSKEMDNFYSEEYMLKVNINELNNLITELTQQLKNTPISKIMKQFHVGKQYRLQQEIASKTQELQKFNLEISKLERERSKTQEKITSITKELKNNDIQNHFKLEDDEIVIIDDFYQEALSKANTTGLTKRNGETFPQSEVEGNKKFFVHATDFFPKNHTILSNFDGEKTFPKTISYRGLPEKECFHTSHRHEVHFTINMRVMNTGAGEGNWDNCPYMILDKYDLHEKEMENISASDSWTKGTSVKLSNDSIIMVPIQSKGKLPLSDDELNKYNIVYYDGNPDECLKNLLIVSGYPPLWDDPRNPAHYNSSRMKQESAAMYRDLAINYLRDNTYNGKNPISLSEEEILLTLDIINKSHGHVPNEFDITTIEYQIYGDTFDQVTKSLNTEQLEAFLYIANFVIGSGLKPNNNGTYTFKNDEEVIQDLEHIKNNPKDTSNILNIELVTHLFTRYQQLRANLDTMQPEQIQDLIDKMYHNQYAENRTGNNKR